MKKVRALKVGFDNICIRKKGEVFEWPHDEIPAWTEEVEPSSSDEAVEEKNPKKQKAQTTKSQPNKNSGDVDVI